MVEVGSRALRWLLLCVLAASTVVFVAVGFALGDNDIRTTRGSLLFRLTIDAPIRDVPVLEAKEDPVYELRTGDGARTGELSISYLSRAQPPAISAAIEHYFLDLGYQISKPGEGEPTYERPGSHIYVTIDSKGPALRWVVVRELL